MKNRIKRELKGGRVLLLFIVTTIVYVFMLVVTIPKVMSFAGGMKLLDMLPTGYSPSYVESLLNNLGEDGRKAYLFIQISMDMIYPLLFGITYCLIIAYFLEKLGRLDTPLFYACISPLFAGLFDYCENLGTITMLTIHPHHSTALARITGIFSVLKSAFTTVSFIFLIAIVVVIGIRKLVSRDSIAQ